MIEGIAGGVGLKRIPISARDWMIIEWLFAVR